MKFFPILLLTEFIFEIFLLHLPTSFICEKCEPIFKTLCVLSGSISTGRKKRQEHDVLLVRTLYGKFASRIFLLAALVSQLPSPCSQNANPYSKRFAF